MKVLVIYLLQVIAVSGLLYGYYHLVLRNNRFHQYNRFYLLSAAVISIIIPFLDIPYYFTPAEKKSSFVLQTITAISPEQYNPVTPGNYIPDGTSGQVSLSTVLLIIYLVIAVIVTLRLILSLLYIRRLIHRNAKEQLGHIQFIHTSEPGTPFSFFRWLFWNRDIELQSDKGQQVFRHEVFHIEQKHSYDLLFMELLTVVGWFNPFFHLIKKELKAIHEFLADRFAINENTKWEYAEMLLMQALHTKQSLVNPFFQTHIKRRIAMITHSKKPVHQYARKLLVIPVAVIAVALFAFSYHEKSSSQKHPDGLVNISPGADTTIHPKQAGVWSTKPDQSAQLKADYIVVSDNKDSRKVDFEKTMVVINGEIKQPAAIYNKLIQADSIFVYKADDPKAIALYGEKARDGLMVFKNATLTDAFKSADTTKPVKDADKIFDKVEVPPSFIGGDRAWRDYLEKNLDGSIPFKKNAPYGTYTVVIMFLVDKNGAISEAKPLTKHGYGMEQEAIRVVGLSPAWKPAQQNGRIVKAYFRQPITFVVKKRDKNDPASTALSSDDNMVFTKVENEPYFPGGEAKFREYIAYNQQTHSKELAQSPFTQSVILQFLVKADGTVSDVKLAAGTPSSAYATLALNLIKDGPKWAPGVQNGRTVNAYKTQAVVFASPDGKLPTTSQWIQASGSKTPSLSVEELKQATVYQLLALPNGTDITGYLFSIDMDNGDIKQVANKGAYFNAATKDIINQAKAGKLITFDQIKIMENGIEKRIPAKVYELVN